MKILSFLNQQVFAPRQPDVARAQPTPETAATPPPAAETPPPAPAEPTSAPADVPAAAAPRTPLQEVAQNYRVRAISPREITDLSFDLHVAGFLSYEEYSLLAFQPELHPDFDKTTGALIGERADPDRPRDFVALWEERLNFERQHNPEDTQTIARVERILGVLQAIDSPTNIVV